MADYNYRDDEHLLMSIDLSMMFQIEAEPQQGILWKDEEGKATDDPEKVATKERIKIPRWKYAATDVDFKRIFEREFKKHPGLTDRRKFKEIQIEVVESKLKKYKGENPGGIDPEIFEISQKYIDFLSSNKTPVKDFGLKPGVTDELVNKYHHWLLKKGFIDCTIEQFTGLFSNDPLPAGWEPIKWYGYASPLAAIILELLDAKQSNPWKIKMSQFFINRDNEPIKPNLRSGDLNRYLPLEKDIK